VTLAAVGDVVMHMPIVDSAFKPDDGSYDFRSIFAELKSSLSQADLAVGVLETQLTGADQIYTGYPAFKTPASIADALKWAGIGLVFTAHNHSLDQGIDGLEQTLTYLDQINLPYVGCRYNKNQARYRIIDCKGIKLAFLAYTTTTNGQHLPTGQEWRVNIFDRQKILEDISTVRLAGVDCIIMALHTGVEYQRTPSTEQQKMIDWLVKSGVDIVLGSHVHVVQPLEFRNFYDPVTGDNRDCFIAYSLGNLLSNQRWRYSDNGLQVNIKLAKKLDHPGVIILGTGYIPLWVNRFVVQGKYHYRIIQLTGSEYQGTDSQVDSIARKRISEVWSETTELLGDWANKNAGGKNDNLLK
jgi:poly-gamma-glutamate capsule biosynthesis protein CapA/YwtB (metallophosphatase superfamily)